jgi:phosphoenolpyruvate carboxylase
MVMFVYENKGCDEQLVDVKGKRNDNTRLIRIRRWDDKSNFKKEETR